MTPTKAEQTAVLPDYLRKRGLIRATIFGPINTWKMLLLAVAFLWLHHGYLTKLVHVWWTEPDWSHGFIIPLFCLYFLASNYQKLLKVKIKPAYSGIVVVMLGLALETTAFFLRNDYGVYLGMIALLFGMVLWLAGWQVIKIVWLPILFLIFAVNVPEMIYRDIAYQLQQFAAQASVVVLQLLNIQADMAGELGKADTVISMLDAKGYSHQLNVEEACSGMRLLMAFGSLAVAISYLSDRAAWQRVVLILCALPVAVFCNLLRVVITGVLYHQGYPEYAQGIFHTFTGLLMLIPAGLMYLGIAKLLDMLVIVDYDQAEPAAAPKSDNPGPVDVTHCEDSASDQNLSVASTDKQAAQTDKSTKVPVWRQIVADKHFLVCFVIVLLAAGGLEAGIRALQIELVKKAAPLRAELASLPQELGSFKAFGRKNPETGEVHIDGKLPEDFIHALGTDIYLDRSYRDTQTEPDLTRTVSVFTTHYTGKPVLVPHTPERCQAAVGSIQTGSETFRVKIPGLGLDDDTLSVRASIFTGNSATGTTKTIAIIYIFVANGKYFDDYKITRWHLTKPQAYFWDEYSYYAFFRLTFPESNDKQQCIATAKKFLKAALPEMVKIWPDWEELKKTQ